MSTAWPSSYKNNISWFVPHHTTAQLPRRLLLLLADLHSCRCDAVHMHVQLQVRQLASCSVVVGQLMAGRTLCVEEAWGALWCEAQGLANQVEGDDADL